MILFRFCQRNRGFWSAGYRPAFVAQYGLKYEFHLKSSNIGWLASYGTQNSKYFSRLLYHLILQKVLNLAKTKIDKIKTDSPNILPIFLESKNSGHLMLVLSYRVQQ